MGYPAFAYIGTLNTGPPSRGGIHVYGLDPDCGALTPIEVIPLASPSFLAVSARQGFLYAACRGWEFDRRGTGAVVAFQIDPRTGRLRRVNQVEVPAHPAYVSVDRSGRFAFVASTFAGTIAVLPLEPDGGVKPASQVIQHGTAALAAEAFVSNGVYRWPRRPGTPFPHSIRPDLENSVVYVPDVGLNRLAIYGFDEEAGTLTPGSPPWVDGPALDTRRDTHDPKVWDRPTGAGPRHLDFHPSGRAIYVVNETGSTVSVLSGGGAEGPLEHIQEISTLPATFRGENLAGDIHVHPSGHVLYASNRGEDSIVTFHIDRGTHALELRGATPCGGSHPRSFSLTPDSRFMFVANTDSDSISTFRVDEASGELTTTGATVPVDSPSCVTFFRSARS